MSQLFYNTAVNWDRRVDILISAEMKFNTTHGDWLTDIKDLETPEENEVDLQVLSKVCKETNSMRQIEVETSFSPGSCMASKQETAMLFFQSQHSCGCICQTTKVLES